MVWKLTKGDIISLKNNLYYYEVNEIFHNKVILQNLLLRKYKEFKLKNILKEAKIIRRKD